TPTYQLLSSQPPCRMYSAQWPTNPACPPPQFPPNSSSPLLRALLSAMHSHIPSIPPSPPLAPTTLHASSARKRSTTSNASTSVPPHSSAAITPFSSTLTSNSAWKTSAVSLSGLSSTL